ncbi:MAG TPA: RES family NAD+ phosphorylase [Pseudomonas sp.]|uniref:RES family NAD+ phosphorylase n=1 Tax=Pseudomonas sp. TaxID=306 RepID=UPI002B46234F|nr:RES family NAD+ phosphorylase [Pseudomonas sp.]HKS13676.1 RES family NAD+ phosphorylase [Pseudomonas sp.]
MIEIFKKNLRQAVAQYGLPTKPFMTQTPVYRVQESRYPDPVFYNADSDSRYGDPLKAIGVIYVACSDVTAVAETLQHGNDGVNSPVLAAQIEERSLHTLVTARTLRLVDAAELARNSGERLKAIVESRGQGTEGYAYTRALSSLVMRHELQVDGILYPSQVYPVTGSLAGCNLVLFAGRPDQLIAISKQPLIDLELSTGETVGELLSRIRVPIA